MVNTVQACQMRLLSMLLINYNCLSCLFGGHRWMLRVCVNLDHPKQIHRVQKHGARHTEFSYMWSCKIETSSHPQLIRISQIIWTAVSSKFSWCESQALQCEKTKHALFEIWTWLTNNESNVKGFLFQMWTIFGRYPLATFQELNLYLTRFKHQSLSISPHHFADTSVISERKNTFHMFFLKVGGWNNPSEKYYIVKLDHFLRDRGENKNIYSKTTT